MSMCTGLRMMRVRRHVFCLSNHQIRNGNVAMYCSNTSVDDNDNDNACPLYPGHVRTSPLQKGLLAVGSAIAAFIDPTRQEMVATLGEVTGAMALRKMHDKMMETEEGRQVLYDKPRVKSSTIDLDALSKLPHNTFGYAYWSFLSSEGVTPDSRENVKFVDDAELAYIMQRYRENHDYWHTLLGMGTSVGSEVAVKWFEMVQTGLPMNVISAVVGPLRLENDERAHLAKKLVPWSVETGLGAECLMAVYYEKHFEEPLEEFRERLGVQPPLFK